MKNFAVILALCLLLGGCTAQDIPETQKADPPVFQEKPPTESQPEYPTPPEPPTGENSDAPAPGEGPEGLPTPAL